MNRVVKSLLVTVLGVNSASAANWKAADVDMFLKGYVKLDYVQVQGDGSASAINRSLTIPAAIVNDDAGTRSGFQVLESRFGFGTQKGNTSSYIEMDFYLSATGDENISNSFNPRLRHAYFKDGNWLFGQSWSNFMILSSLSEQLDFGGFAGQVFVRQPGIRFTKNFGKYRLDLSVENAETTYGQGEGASLSSAAADQDSTPDFIGKVSHVGEYGSVAMAIMHRTHSAEDSTESKDTGVAYTFGGELRYGVGSSFKFAYSGGNLGRYGSFTTQKDAVFTASENTLEATETNQWHLGVRQLLTNTWRFNFDYGVGVQETFVASSVKKVSTIRANIIKQRSKNISYGFEWAQADVTRYEATKALGESDGARGSRYMFSAKYSF